MTDNQNEPKLFSNFPTVTPGEWKDKITIDLKVKDIGKLCWETIEGIKVAPFYTKADLDKLGNLETQPGKFPFLRGVKTVNNDWNIRQDFVVKDCSPTNNKLHEAIYSGITEAGFEFPPGKTFSPKKLEALINGINAKKIRLNFSTGENVLNLIKHVVNAFDNKTINPLEIKGAFEFDPLGHLILYGKFYSTEKADLEVAGKLIQYGEKHIPKFNLLTLHGNIFGNAGASIVQELGFTLAMGAEYLAKLASQGIEPSVVAERMQLTMSIGSNYFMEIAKIRATRLLWSSIVKAFEPGIKNTGLIYIHSKPSLWNKTKYDPYVNMLRYTTEVMSAAIGGADSISFFPFNKILKQPGAFSERIARNTQVILKEEAYFNKIVDPAAGSYYIENLTDSVANQAWNIFKEVESLGGFVAAFRNGFIMKQVASSQAKRKNNIAYRKEILVGTNHYPDLKEQVNESIFEKESPVEYSKNQLFDSQIFHSRGAEDFETLRQKTERPETKKPVAVLFPFGDPAKASARTIFATNFMGTGGFQVIDLNGIKSIEEGINACKERKPEIIVFCSSDGEYFEFISQVAVNLNIKSLFIVSGYPADMLTQLQKLGVKHFIHLKSNVLETHRKIQKDLGIE